MQNHFKSTWNHPELTQNHLESTQNHPRSIQNHFESTQASHNISKIRNQSSIIQFYALSHPSISYQYIKPIKFNLSVIVSFDAMSTYHFVIRLLTLSSPSMSDRNINQST